jgi:hypothetical protein
MEHFDPNTSMANSKSHDDIRPPAMLTPEPEYPHKTHDSSALSYHFLNATAFSAQVSMNSADHLRRSGKDISACYSAISARNTSAAPLLASRTAVIDYSTINYDRTGILFEYREHFYVVLEAAVGKDAARSRGIECGFLHRSRLGMPLVYEWESMPKRRACQYGVGASGSARGWWNVHSRTMMRLRNLILSAARNVEVQRSVMEKPYAEILFRKQLESQFKRVVNAHYGTLRVQEKKALEEVESAWEEFMVTEV